MKNHKYQQINVRFDTPFEAKRFSAETDKQFCRIKGIFVSVKNEAIITGTLLGLKVNGQDVFDDNHEVRLLTCGNQVAPNQKFYFFEEHLEASGSSIEGKLTDGGVLNEGAYPLDVKIYLWLTNDPYIEKKGE